MKRLQKKFIGFTLIWTFLLSGCGQTEEAVHLEDLNLNKTEEVSETPLPTTAPTPTPTPEPTPTPTPTPEPTPEPPKEINLMMVGDNLLHMGIVNTGKQEDGTYNYDILFEGIEDFLVEADIKMINQETIFGGNEKGFSG